jgi:serine/threonine protein phosphatase PrpC
MRFKTATVSHAGGRKHNEDFCDYCSAADGGGCWVIADGLGGHVGGDIASHTAVRAFMESYAAEPQPLNPDAMLRHLQAAHNAVLERQRADPRHTGMRTTLLALISDGSAALWAHVGDSRLYCLRNGRIVAQTKDHSVPKAMVDAGEIRPEDIRYHEDRNRLLRDLGGEKGIRPTLLPEIWTLQPGDSFLLCTDGFWEHITETAMVAEHTKSGDPQQWLDNMRRRIGRNVPDEHDNYTAIAIFIEN